MLFGQNRKTDVPLSESHIAGHITTQRSVQLVITKAMCLVVSVGVLETSLIRHVWSVIDSNVIQEMLSSNTL
jgi:hypothetical protein